MWKRRSSDQQIIGSHAYVHTHFLILIYGLTILILLFLTFGLGRVSVDFFVKLRTARFTQVSISMGFFLQIFLIYPFVLATKAYKTRTLVTYVHVTDPQVNS